MKPLEVKLHVCPLCGEIGKMPSETYHGKVWCRGPRGVEHRRLLKQVRLFREVR
jgi:hypothetical protein